MENPGKLFHATVTRDVPAILELGLQPFGDGVNLSTDDETDLVAFFGHANGCIDYKTEKPLHTITLLEVDTTGLTLVWPGQDGDHHFVCMDVIPPERIRVVSECTLERVAEGAKGEPLTLEDTDALNDFFAQMEKNAAAHAKRTEI